VGGNVSTASVALTSEVLEEFCRVAGVVAPRSCVIRTYLRSCALLNGMLPVSSEISDLILFFSYFACQNKEIKSGNYFFDVYCVN